MIMKILFFFSVIVVLVNSIGVCENPQFEPTRLMINLEVPVSESSTEIKFEKRTYLVLGESYYNDPIRLGSNDKGSMGVSFREQFELFSFIASLTDHYQGVEEISDILEFSEVYDKELFLSILSRHWGKIREQYNSVDYFRFKIGWFRSPVDVEALIEIVPVEGDSYTIPMVFTLTESGWRVKSGFSSDQRFSQDIYTSGHVGEVEVFGFFDGIKQVEELYMSEDSLLRPQQISSELVTLLEKRCYLIDR